MAARSVYLEQDVRLRAQLPSHKLQRGQTACLKEAQSWKQERLKPEDMHSWVGGVRFSAGCCNDLLRIHPHLYSSARRWWCCDRGSGGPEQMVGGEHGQAHRKDPRIQNVHCRGRCRCTRSMWGKPGNLYHLCLAATLVMESSASHTLFIFLSFQNIFVSEWKTTK